MRRANNEPSSVLNFTFVKCRRGRTGETRVGTCVLVESLYFTTLYRHWLILESPGNGGNHLANRAKPRRQRQLNYWKAIGGRDGFRRRMRREESVPCGGKNFHWGFIRCDLVEVENLLLQSDKKKCIT